ncbi:hypothetical protein A4A49_44953, partial [Nicotiana attenuata]
MDHEDLFLLDTTATAETTEGNDRGVSSDQTDQAAPSQEHVTTPESESETSILAPGNVTQEEQQDHMPQALPEPLNVQLSQPEHGAALPIVQSIPPVPLRRSARGVKPVIWLKDYYTGNS